ncbi:GNAT family N-acetyltransferase [Rhodanobacter sp. Col0626]|uniref:GNAT family N-acetyltransferase n=1 Tax=Rhodanobacter sp. Col0626 TaxID=3415679 RepID=UPI003CE804F7
MNRHEIPSSADAVNARKITDPDTAATSPKDTGDSAELQVGCSRRLTLRSIGYVDIPDLSRLYASTMRHPLLVESPTRFIDVAAQVARINRCYATRPGLGVWRADTHDGHFIGTFSLLPVEDSDDVQVGARLTPEVWGRWYAIEGGHLLCRQAFESLGLPRLIGYCHRDHLTARRVLTRFGFQDMGVHGDPTRLVQRYELDASAWREARRLYT